MHKHNITEPWLINLNELRDTSKMTYKQIADVLQESERTISRVFTGETKSPGVELVRRIIHTMGGCMADVFGEGAAYIASQDVLALQLENEELKGACAKLLAENELLKTKNAALTDELLDVVKYFTKAKE